MSRFGSEQGPVSPYIDELINAKCVKLLAIYVSGMQTCLVEEQDMTMLLAGVESVRQEFYASPEDMQLALQANEGQLLFGAPVGDPEADS